MKNGFAAMKYRPRGSGVHRWPVVAVKLPPDVFSRIKAAGQVVGQRPTHILAELAAKFLADFENRAPAKAPPPKKHRGQ